MDTPESPTQSPQSPEEEDMGLSDSELLDSADDQDDRVMSGSDVVNDEENELDEDDKDGENVENRGRGSELEERHDEDEVVPDFVSDPEDDEPVEETSGMGQEDETIMLMEGDEDGTQGDYIDGEEEQVDTPQSPDSEPGQVRRFIAEDDDDREDGYGYYRKTTKSERATVEVDDDEEDEVNKTDEEKTVRIKEDEMRRAVMVRELDDDSASVSRELDEHELDYDEEVPEEPSIAAHEDEEEEEDAKVEGDEDEDKIIKKEKKPILPPSPKDSDSKRPDDSKGLERLRKEKDSYRDKTKEEDDGEIDEGEIDVSDHSLALFSSSVFEISDQPCLYGGL